MKKLLIYLSILMFINSCTNDIPTIGEKINRKDQMIGTWQLEKFVQTDLKAKSNGYPYFATEKDLTNVFQGHPYTDFSISFNSNGTFSTNTGSSFVEMISDGKWSFDSDDLPSKILLSNESGNQTIIIGSFANIVFDKIEFKVEKIDPVTKKKKVLYTYYLNKK
jgi:hypothetical protein